MEEGTLVRLFFQALAQMLAPPNLDGDVLVAESENIFLDLVRDPHVSDAIAHVPENHVSLPQRALLSWSCALAFMHTGRKERQSTRVTSDPRAASYSSMQTKHSIR